MPGTNMKMKTQGQQFVFWKLLRKAFDDGGSFKILYCIFMKI